MDKRAHGFTIVELLIVIIIIAILAAIATVAYKGIRDRAEAARAASAAQSYAKILQMHYTSTNSYPSSTASPTDEYCLGNPADFPAAGVFSAGMCLYNPSGPYTVSTSQTLHDALNAYGIASNTKLSDARLGTETWRGFRYSYNPALSYPPLIEWVVNGSVSCAPGTGSPGTWWGSTWCTLEIK